MAIGGAFLGGGAEIVPAGFCKLELEILTEDRNNLVATFSIKGTSTYTVTAGADGRAVYTVPSGQTYTVSVNTTGYDNIASQTVVAESGTVRYVRFEAFEGRVKRSGDTMTGVLTIDALGGNAPINIRNPNMVVGTPTNTFKDIRWCPKDSNDEIGLIRCGHQSDGTGYLRFRAFNTDRVGSNDVYLKVDKDGNTQLTAPSWSVGTNDNSDKILTIKMANSLPSLVHTTGNETVAGTKTFTSPIYLNNNAPLLQQRKTDFTVGTLPTSTDIGGVRVIDSVGTYFAGFRWTVNPSGDGEAYIETNNFDKTVVASLKVYAKANKDTYATAPTTPSTATSNEIATADWSIGKFVPLDGSKAMTGGLVINTTYPRLDLVRNDYVHGTAPTSEKIWALTRVLDNGTSKRTLMTNELKVNTSETFTYSTSVYDSNNKWHYPFVIKWAKDYSTVEVTAPTPSDKADNSTKISTTAWVNSASSVVHTTGNETIAGAKTFVSYPFALEQEGRLIGSPFDGFRDIRYADKNGGEMGCYRFGQKTSGEGYISLITFNNDKSANARIEVHISGDGKYSYGSAPTTPTNATSSEIATADWVNNKLATRVQKLTLNGTISDGVIVTNDIQANDTVFVSITTPSDISPITYAVDIPSTVEGAMLVRSSSHITEKSDGKLYSIDIYAQYRKTAWHIGIIQRGITGGGVSNPAVVSFYGHILRAG